MAWPDRLARCVHRVAGSDTRYLLSNGRRASLPEQDRLAGRDWLAVAELGGHTGSREDRIYLATPFDATLLEDELQGLVQVREQVEWDASVARLVALRKVFVGKLL